MAHTVCIHQPDFVPYLGFFDRLLDVDQFIILDDVQFIRRGWQHRDVIKGPAGRTWLSLSIAKSDYHSAISDIQLAADRKWVDANLNLLAACYSKARYFSKVFGQVETIYRASHVTMMGLNMAFLRLAFEYFAIDVPLMMASEFDVNTTKTERLVQLALAVGADEYLTGTGSKEYLDESLFEQSGVSVRWQKFSHPVYPQLHGAFIPMLSCLDVIFNCGYGAADVLRSGRPKAYG